MHGPHVTFRAEQAPEKPPDKLEDGAILTPQQEEVSALLTVAGSHQMDI